MSARAPLMILIALAAIALMHSGCDDSPESSNDATVGAGGGAGEADAEPMPDAQAMPDAESPDAAAADAGEPDASLEADAMAPDAEPPADWTSTPCSDAERVGVFEIILARDYTAAQGQIFDSVAPLDVPTVDTSEGECALLRPPVLFCEPSCEVGLTCGEAMECVPQPAPIDLGPVVVTGLTAPVEMEARAPVYFYTFRGDLPHPAFAEGDPITLTGDGLDGSGPLVLRGAGVAPVQTALESVALDPGQAAEVTWEAPGVDGPAQMHVELNIANHGGTPARVVCTTADDGELAIPASLIDRLLELGFSGFPSLTLTRRTVDRNEVASGCVELRVTAVTVLDVAIDGLISCSFDEDCPPDQMCRPDLTCGPAAEENP